MSKTPKVVIFRSSVTGRIVKESFAKTHPNTTERQHVAKPTPKKSK
jgi:hypothetical protein